MKIYKWVLGGGLSAFVILALLFNRIPHFVSALPTVTGTEVLLGGAPFLHASAAVADFNGDGYLEIVAGTSDGVLHVVAYNGSTWSSVWSRQTALDINAAGPAQPKSTNKIESAPIIADLDGDTNLEIVITTGGLPADKFNGGLLVYEYQSDSAWSFAIAGTWPQPRLDLVGGGAGAGNPDGYWDGIYASPAVGDLDGDGDLEIVYEGEDRSIHAYHHDGTVVSGWPFFRDNGDPVLRGGLSSPALGDIDGDGLLDIVVGGNSPQWAGEGTDPNYTVAAVWALKGDSTIITGWPQYAGDWVDSSPALGDIDDDGELEIIVGTGRDGINRGDTGGRYVYAWNVDGSVVSGWPRSTGANMGSSPALADLDEDGTLDVIIGCGVEEASTCYNLYAWHGDGTNVAGFPMQPVTVNPWGHTPQRLPYPPVVADIDGDAHLEILLTMAGSNGVSVVEHTGAMSTDYSRIQSDYTIGMMTSPVVADVDNDGLLETVGTGVGTGPQAAIYIWDEVATVTAAQPWPMFHRDSARTGQYPLDGVPPTNPTTIAATPDANTWTNDNTIAVTWSGASDADSGVDRYYYVWDMTLDTLPTATDQHVAEPTHTLTGAPLADGETWYFHLRTADKLGNLATDALHLGPFKIDTTAPSSQASSPTEVEGDITVSWSGTDGGSGIDTYTIQVREGSSGTWSDWLTDVAAATSPGDYVAGTCGSTYYFRSLAMDAAGNQEPGAPEGDSSTLSITGHALQGLVTNNIAEPVWGAQAASTGACASAKSQLDGTLTLYYPMAGTYDVTVSHDRFAALETVYGLSTTVSISTTFVLPPVDDAVQNGGFETGDFSSWDWSGNLSMRLFPHSGEYGVIFSGSGVLSQTLTVPDNGVLSVLYRVFLDMPGATFVISSASVSVSPVQGSNALSLTLSTVESPWTHYWLDVGALVGEEVVLTVPVDANGAYGGAFFDEITLGGTAPGKHVVFLPIIMR